MSPVLEVVDLDCGYGQLAAVRKLNLHADRSEVVALLGPNGAGKTTTLLTLVGVLPPLAGRVLFDAVEQTGPPHRRAKAGVAFVPEGRGVFAHLTVEENLRIGAGPPADAVALFPELEPLLSRRAGLTSGGEQQMLALARALAGKPRLVLVDELSQGLAPLVVARLMQALRAAADAGATVVLVEQQVDRALEFADRAYVLRGGELVAAATASELRTDPERLQALYLAEKLDGMT